MFEDVVVRQKMKYYCDDDGTRLVFWKLTRRRFPIGGGEEQTDDNFRCNYRERPLATRTACPSEKCTFSICISTIINAREVVQ